MDGSCRCEDVRDVGKGFNKNRSTEGEEERENRMLDALIDGSHMFGRSQPRIVGGRMKMFGGKEGEKEGISATELAAEKLPSNYLERNTVMV